MLKYFLRFSGLNLFFVTILFILYFPQALIAALLFPTDQTIQLFNVLCFALFSFVIFIFFFKKTSFSKIRTIKIRINMKILVTFLIGTYFLVMLYSGITAPKIALLASLTGSGSGEIASAREALFRSRTGGEVFLLYIYAIFAKTIMPLCILWLFYSNHKFKLFVSALYLFTLLLSLEKSLPIFLFLPLIIYFYNEKDFKNFRYSFVGLILFLLLTIILSKSGTSDITSIFKMPYGKSENFVHQIAQTRGNTIKQYQKNTLISKEFQFSYYIRDTQSTNDWCNLIRFFYTFHKDKDINRLSSEKDFIYLINHTSFQYNPIENILHSSFNTCYTSFENNLQYGIQNILFENFYDGFENERNIFGNKERQQVFFILNRLFWIPYITALDWLRYFQIEFNGTYLNGRSIAPLSFLFDTEVINMEREVFRYEWGQNETNSGRANTAFFIDAFVNFGYTGVFLYCLIVAFIFHIIGLSNNKIAVSVFYLQAYSLTISGLTPMIFSGGLIFTFLFSLIKLEKPISLSRIRME
jgi:hypothetical protein